MSIAPTLASHGAPPAHGATPAARAALVVALVVAGLHAGFFLTYEISVTPALALVDDLTYVTGFRAINEAVLTPTFMLLFAGAAPLTGLSLSLRRRDPRARTLLGLALVAHLAVIAVTATGNIPLNERLADLVVTPESATAARAWFEQPWNGWNLARTIATAGAFCATAAALVSPGSGSRADA